MPVFLVWSAKAFLVDSAVQCEPAVGLLVRSSLVLTLDFHLAQSLLIKVGGVWRDFGDHGVFDEVVRGRDAGLSISYPEFAIWAVPA